MTGAAGGPAGSRAASAAHPVPSIGRLACGGALAYYFFLLSRCVGVSSFGSVSRRPACPPAALGSADDALGCALPRAERPGSPQGAAAAAALRLAMLASCSLLVSLHI